MKFKELGIIEPILKSIEEQGFENPTQIQEESIPLITSGEDVIGGSATGSGKTLAFGSGIIQNSDKKGGIQAMILTPTRELAEQVGQALKTFSKYKKLGVACIYGGIYINPQIARLRKVEIVVGTPGRLLDHIGRGTIDLMSVKTLVLDEADVMLDMGFINDVEKIMKACPRERQTLLFSATITPELDRLSKRYMKSPKKISAESYVDSKKLKQIYYNVPDNQKFSLLVQLLKNDKAGLTMVFCNTQKNTDFVEKNLNINGIKSLAIHGGFSQARRTKTMEEFNNKNLKVLVCTDVAARGLDIKGVSHVYNYDLPKESKQYIHRIGRTARAGSEGEAINILSSRDHDNYSRILRDNDVSISQKELPDISRAKIGWKGDQGRRSGGFGGNRSFNRRGNGSHYGSDRRSNSSNFGGDRRGHTSNQGSSRRRRAAWNVR